MNKITITREDHERLHFNLHANRYDVNYGYLEPFTKYKIAKKMNSLKKFVNDTFGRKPLTILEIGCGTGEYTKKIAEAYPKSKIVGLDISPGILRIAALKCKGLSNVTFVSKSAYNTFFSENRFDMIVGFYVLHHINIARFAKEALRILKMHGAMYFYEPNILNPVVYTIKSSRYLKKRVGDSPDEWAINPLTIKREFRGFKHAKISTSEFIFPINFIPLRTMIVLDTILSHLAQIPLVRYLGGSVQISLLK